MNINSLFKTVLLSSAASMFIGCANDNSISDNQQEKGHGNSTTVTFTSEPAQQTGSTRTTLEHVFNAGAKVLWSDNDKIFVKADDGHYYQSSTPTFVTAVVPATIDKTRAMFTPSGGTYAGDTYPVRYTGSNGSDENTVTIATTQIQSGPNNFDHLGTSGDCGIATATGGGGSFGFRLEHKSAYLCFLPRTTSAAFQACKLIRIEIYSDHDIAGTYSLSDAGLSATPTSGASHAITLNTGSGFPLTNSTTDVTTNGAYMVIAPGTHALTVRYWLETPAGKTGTVSKFIPSANYDAGKIYDLTANFDTRVYSGELYGWDAVSNPYPSGDYDDDEHKSVATHTAAVAPNVYEMFWYADQGDIHWDDTQELFVTAGTIYQGGIWIKRKSNISDFSSTQLPPGVGLIFNTKTYSRPIVPPTNDILSQYFYLPALGCKGRSNGYFFIDKPVGTSATYWSSTATTGRDNTIWQTRAYYLDIEKGSTRIGVSYILRLNGFAVTKFED